MRTADGAFLVGLDQRILEWTPSAEQLLGLTADQVQGKPCYDVICGKDSRDYRFCRRDCPVIVDARRGRPTPDYDILSQRADGSPVWLNASVLILDRDGDQPTQVLHLFRDVTTRRRLEEKAQRALAALREVVGDEENTSRTDYLPNPYVEAPISDTPVPRLSRRETQVLRLLAVGLATSQIADSLAVSPITARNHISRVLTKLGVQSRLQAVVYASRRGLI